MRAGTAVIAVLAGGAMAAPASAPAQEVPAGAVVGGGLLPYTTPPRGYRPSVGMTLRPAPPRLAVRFDTTLLCGRDSFDVSARRSVPFAAASAPAPVAAHGTDIIAEGGGRRLTYTWRLTGAIASGQASGSLHITGTLHSGRRRATCRAVPDRPWVARAGVAPSGPVGPPPPGATFLGSTSQDLSAGLPGAVIVRVTRDGRKVAARWTAAARCGHGSRELLVNVTPPTRLAGAAFTRSERFSQRFADAVVRYRTRFSGRTAADGASGTLRLRARVFDAHGGRLRTSCDSGTIAWRATAAAGAAPSVPAAPAAGVGTTTDVPFADVLVRAARWSLHVTSDPGDAIGQGGTYDYVSPSTPLTVPEVAPGGVVLQFGGPGAQWELDFRAPPGRLFRAGVTYQAGPTIPESAFLDVAGNGHGCIQKFGTFTVDAIAYDGRGLRTFVARFVHHCELAAPALRATVTFRAT